jgi:spore coat polysaccharide biosynthesis protein SpsF
MKTVAIIQARMGSTRLPGKVLKTLGEKPVLWHVVRRVRAATGIDDLIVATSTADADVEILNFCLQEGVNVYRGSEFDVLARFYQAAKMMSADIILRFTADCPLLDPEVITEMIREFRQERTQESKPDYFSNIQTRTFPRGLDTEIFTFSALEKTFQTAGQPFEREHVTPFMYQHPEKFVCAEYRSPEDNSRFRLTLDTHEDYELLTAIFTHFAGMGPGFSLKQVLDFLREFPDLEKINAHIEQKKLSE